MRLNDCNWRWIPWDQLVLAGKIARIKRSMSDVPRSKSTATLLTMPSRGQTHISSMYTWGKASLMTGSACLLAVRRFGMSRRFMRLLHFGFIKVELIRLEAAPVSVEESYWEDDGLLCSNRHSDLVCTARKHCHINVVNCQLLFLGLCLVRRYRPANWFILNFWGATA